MNLMYRYIDFFKTSFICLWLLSNRCVVCEETFIKPYNNAACNFNLKIFVPFNTLIRHVHMTCVFTGFSLLSFSFINQHHLHITARSSYHIDSLLRCHTAYLTPFAYHCSLFYSEMTTVPNYWRYVVKYYLHLSLFPKLLQHIRKVL